MDRKNLLIGCIGVLALAGATRATPYDKCGTFIMGLEGCTLLHPDDGSDDVNAGSPPMPFHVGDHVRVRGNLDPTCASFCSAPCVMDPTVTACGSTPPCHADFDGNGSLSVQDIFVFLGAWFAQGPGTDFDGNGTIAVTDIFAYLNAWFAGCP